MEANIRRLLNFLESSKISDWQIVLLVNGSSDASGNIAQRLAAENSKIKAITTPQPGKGRAVMEYFQRSSADILIYMDIDLAVSLDNLPALITAIEKENYDLAFGSRLLKDSRTDRGLIRDLGSRGYNLLARLILHHPFSDLQCGFKAIKKEVAQKLAPKIEDKNWFFDTELIVLAQRAGYRLQEIAVDWKASRYEKRKSHIKIFRDVWRFLRNLIKLKMRLEK